MALKSGTGIINYPEYAGTKAMVEELKGQNSYFINSLYTDAGERYPHERTSGMKKG